METSKGFRDFESSKRIIIRNILEETFSLYGFSPYETPIIEYEDFVTGDNTNDGAVSDTFKLQDKGKRKLALRYEFTFQLKRLAKNKKLPFRRYQIGPVFRDEPVKPGRFRQFTQCDADIIGSTVKDEAEILKIVSEIFKKLKVKVTININNRRLLNEILEKEGIKEKNREEVIREIDKLDKLPEEEVKKNLEKYKAEELIALFKKTDSFFKKYKSYKEVEELEKYCKMYGVNIAFQSGLARGLSYYNGSVFEIKTRGMKETIAAGGSYPVEGVQATGISFGLDRLEMLAKTDVESKTILIISLDQDKRAIQLAEKLRKSGTACLIMYGKPGKSLGYANSLKIPYVILLGKEEVKQGKIKLRDMKTGREMMVSEKEFQKEALF